MNRFISVYRRPKTLPDFCQPKGGTVKRRIVPVVPGGDPTPNASAASPAAKLLKGPNRPNPAGEILIVAMLTAKIGKIDVSRHVRGLLRRRPVSEIVGHTAVSKIDGAVSFQVAVHQSQLVSGRQKPPTNSVQAEVGA
jgi:hypothetical protein